LLVQISDVHLTRTGSLLPGVHPRDNLVAGLRILETAGIKPDIFLLTGDLADAGEVYCYQDLAELIVNAAAQSNADVVYLPGNHDTRAAFRQHLLGGSNDPAPINQVHWRNGLRIVTVDSTVPGEDFGEVDDKTREFLISELETPAPEGTVLALHHPPIPSPIAPMSNLRLRNAEVLAEAIAGSDTRIILCGHYHHAAVGTVGHVPVFVSPATAYLADVASTDVFQGTAGSAFSRIDLTGDGDTATVIPIPIAR
jgi:3',5'-cyclic AMP phosphodiesterase CpdA